MAPRRTLPVHPAIVLAKAREAAVAAAADKARRAPHTLTEADLDLIPGKLMLELGNAGHLQRFGIGLPLKPAPRVKVTTAVPAGLTDDQIARMDGNALSKAMSAGLIPGIGARRKGRRHP